MKLSGILYFHRISDFRMGGIAKKNFHMFSELCGDEAMKNVVIVTNMWETVDQSVAEKREKQLITKADFFGSAIDAGAKIVRHHNNWESAEAILRSIIPNVPEPLRIQKETADQNLELHETSAGKFLFKEQQVLIESHKKEIEDLKRKMEADREADRKRMDDRIKELGTQLKTAQDNSDALRLSWDIEKQRLNGEIEDLRHKTKRGWC
jgi:hypothetical protein